MIQDPDPAEILSLFNTFKDQNQTINVKELIEIIEESKSENNCQMLLKRLNNFQKDKMTQNEFTDLFQVDLKNENHFQEVFLLLSQNNSTIDQATFIKVLKEYNININSEEVQGIFQQFYDRSLQEKNQLSFNSVFEALKSFQQP